MHYGESHYADESHQGLLDGVGGGGYGLVGKSAGSTSQHHAVYV